MGDEAIFLVLKKGWESGAPYPEDTFTLSLMFILIGILGSQSYCDIYPPLSSISSILDFSVSVRWRRFLLCNELTNSLEHFEHIETLSLRNLQNIFLLGVAEFNGGIAMYKSSRSGSKDPTTPKMQSIELPYEGTSNKERPLPKRSILKSSKSFADLS